MRFKKYEYYNELLDNVKFIKVKSYGGGSVLDFQAKREYPVQDVSFAYILDYLINIKYVLVTSGLTKSKNNSTLCLDYDTYEDLCQFFNQDLTKITMNNFFKDFELQKSYFNNNCLEVFTFAFTNLKKAKINEYSCGMDF